MAGLATDAFKSKFSVSERIHSRLSMLLLKWSGKNARRRVWLTFDDGPHVTHTLSILKVLDKHNIRATFFVVGRNVEAHQNIVRIAFEAGHYIGNHSYTHPDLTTLSQAEVVEELHNTDKILGQYSRHKKLFRPPFGRCNKIVAQVAADFGFRTVYWNVNSLDYQLKHHQPTSWVHHGIDRIRARPRSTVLMHDIHDSTAAGLESFIEGIRAIGNITFEEPSTL